MNRFFSSSLALSLVYVICGFVFLNISFEHLLLAAVVIVVCGLLPDIDGSSDIPARELAGILAAVSPLLFLEFFPEFGVSSISRLVLVIVCSYVLTRVLVLKLTRAVFKPGGMIHSFPAAIITAELAFLLFWDLPLIDRSYVAFAAFLGFIFHLMIEAYSGVDFVASAVGEKIDKTGGVLKFYNDSWFSNLLVYSSVFFLGFLVVRELFPNLGFSAYLTY